MVDLDPQPILAAARRLSGQLIDTPLIGDLRLPGFTFPADLRVKAECLQVGGTLMFRGYLHWLLRSLGRYKGLVLHGTPRQLLAQAVAASLHRLPACAVVEGELEPGLQVLIQDTGCELLPVAAGDAVQRCADSASQRGFRIMPGLEVEDVCHGVATIGVELAAQMPRDQALVVVSPSDLADPVRQGLRASGLSVEVRGIDQPGDSTEIGAAVRTGLRLCSDPAGLAALATQLEHVSDPAAGAVAATSPTCVILSC